MLTRVDKFLLVVVFALCFEATAIACANILADQGARQVRASIEGQKELWKFQKEMMGEGLQRLNREETR